MLSPPGIPEEDVARRQAADWFACMQRPDANAHQGAFEQWRAADPRNRRAYQSLERSWQQSALIDKLQVGRDRDLSRARSLFYLPPRVLLAAATAVTILLAGTVAIFVRLEGTSGPSVAPVGQSRFATALGQVEPVRLADGSTIILDGGTRIAADLSGKLRTIRLERGRARFDVAHDPLRPFVVEVGTWQVVARGTLFDIDMGRPRVTVTLYRGAVDVRWPAAGGVHAATTRLTPGQRLSSGPGQTVPDVGPTPVGQDRWTGTMLSFDRARLDHVVALSNHYSNDHITIADPSVARLQVTGVFRIDNSKTLADSLAAAFRLHVQRSPSGQLSLAQG